MTVRCPSMPCYLPHYHGGILRDFPHCQFDLYSNSQAGRWHLQARLHVDDVGRRHIVEFDHAVPKHCRMVTHPATTMTGTCPALLTAIDTCYLPPLSETATKKRMRRVTFRGRVDLKRDKQRQHSPFSWARPSRRRRGNPSALLFGFRGASSQHLLVRRCVL